MLEQEQAVCIPFPPPSLSLLLFSSHFSHFFFEGTRGTEAYGQTNSASPRQRRASPQVCPCSTLQARCCQTLAVTLYCMSSIPLPLPHLLILLLLLISSSHLFLTLSSLYPNPLLTLAIKEWYQLLTSGKPIKITDVRKPLESQVLYYVEGAWYAPSYLSYLLFSFRFVFVVVSRPNKINSDNQGRNIIFWDMSNYDVDVTPEPVLMRTFVYCLERATERYGSTSPSLFF